MPSQYPACTWDFLKDYTFTLNEEWYCGYDQQGYPWQEPELSEKRIQGLIIKECNAETVFFKRSLIGYIQETFDGSWLACSPYLPVGGDGVEISGFMNKFYAVRYLHHIALAQYPDSIEKFPKSIYLPWEQDESRVG